MSMFDVSIPFSVVESQFLVKSPTPGGLTPQFVLPTPKIAQERVGGLLPPLRLLQTVAHRHVDADLRIQLSTVHPDGRWRMQQF